MAAFDVTTNPPSQDVKPGSTAKITVVVSNRLGKPVMGRVDGLVKPANAAAWLVPPTEPQRKFEADPTATLTFEFAIRVPASATATVLTFQPTVLDVLAPDDNKVEGQTAAVTVTAEPVVTNGNHRPIPWWVWVVAAVVLLAVGFGIYKVIQPKRATVPQVVGLNWTVAIGKLTEAGFEVDTTYNVRSRDPNLGNTVKAIRPDQGSQVDKGSGVAVEIFLFDPTLPPPCFTRDCREVTGIRRGGVLEKVMLDPGLMYYPRPDS